ncbi:MAG: hypothetical protein H6960_08680 [Chromatiaceae bacterium]|nr:hypothetical protein [Chromatiaceae bacterium]
MRRDLYVGRDAVQPVRLRPGHRYRRRNPRQQTNAVTAFIDASQIYGSSKEAADGLRYFSGGKLKMSDDMLHMEGGAFVSGDERAREQVGLTSMHTLFNREHNRLAAELERNTGCCRISMASLQVIWTTRRRSTRRSTRRHASWSVA